MHTSSMRTVPNKPDEKNSDVRQQKVNNMGALICAQIVVSTSVRITYGLMGANRLGQIAPNERQTSPSNTPFLLPVPIIDDAVIMRQLLQFRIKVFSWLLGSFFVASKSHL